MVSFIKAVSKQWQFLYMEKLYRYCSKVQIGTISLNGNHLYDLCSSVFKVILFHRFPFNSPRPIDAYMRQ